MGTPTDAILWYGYASESEDIRHELESLLRRQGYSEADIEDAPITYALEWARKQTGIKTVTLVSHCSIDFQRFGLAIEKTEYTAHRGFPKPVKPGKLRELEEKKGKRWRDDLKTFAKALDWPKKDMRPGWWLGSWWG